MPKKSVINDFMHCFFIFQVLGLQNFSIKNLQKQGELKTRVKFIIYSIVLLIIVAIQNFTSIAIKYTKESPHNDKVKKSLLSNVLEIVIGFAVFVVTTAIQVSSLLSTCNQRQILLNIQEIAETLENRLKYTVNYRNLKIRAFYKIVITTIFFIVALALVNYIDNILNLMFSFLIILFVGVQFSFYADLINWNLCVLEKTLGELSKLKDSKVFVVQSKFNSNVHSESFHRTLIAIKSIYMMVWETSELINKSFGRQILLFMVVNVICLAYAGYRTCVAFMVADSDVKIGAACILDIINVFAISLVVISVNHSCETVRIKNL